MKKLLTLCFILVLTSCSIDNDSANYNSDNVDYNFEVLPVESVTVPDEFLLGKTYPITVSYFQPTTCHSFKEFYYLKENNIRTVAPINYVTEENNCIELPAALVEETFNFVVTSNGSYVFKFWQGEDSNGEDQYLTIEVPVIE